MFKYIIRRCAEMLLTLFIIATATFFLLCAVPGDPLTTRTSKLPPSIKQAMYKKYGLDRPVGERYLKTMFQMLRGDFGESLIYPGQDMKFIIKTKLPASARLGLQQMILGISVGLLLGILAALHRETWVDYSIVALSVLLISIPVLIFGIMLQYIFAGKLHLFPVIGWPKGKDLWFGGWKYTILPTLSGCFGYISSYARILKTSMLDVVNQDYILTAKAKGLSENGIVKHHILKNSFIPIITYLPLTIVFCITGSFFIERIYSIPGLGFYFINAVGGRDLPIIMGITMIDTIMYVVTILITDFLYTLVDPRIKITGGGR